jgi:hypothetical protein
MGGREDYTAQQIREADPYAYTTSGNTITATELNIANNPQKYIDMGVDHSIVEEIKRKVDASTYVGGESGPIYGGEDKTVTLPITDGGGGGGVQFTDGTGPLATTAATTPATTTTPAGDYTSATMPFENYYVGGAPTTAQEAFMQESGAVPEAVGRDVWARGGRIGYGLGDIVRRNRAKFGAPRRYEDEDEEDYPWIMARGGRAGYAGGGISNLRQGFLFGGIGRKIKKGVKKLIKSDIGKAALMYAATAGLGNLAAGAGAGTGASWGVPWGSAAAGRGWLHPSMVASNIGTGFSGLKEGASNILTGLTGGGGGAKTLEEAAVEIMKRNPGIKWESAIKLAQAGAGKVPGWATAASLGAMTLPYIFPDLGKPDEEDDDAEQQRLADLAKWRNQFAGLGESFRPVGAQGGRIGAQEGGLMNLGGMEKDYRQEGGFVPIGGQEKADDVPARLSKNEFVFTADAVRAAGGGDIDAGAEVMENVMENLEQGGQVSEESQGLEGARNMFATAQRLEGVM